MIRINLLGVERQKPRKAITFDWAKQTTPLACSGVLIATLIGIGGWYLALQRQSTQLDADLASARASAARLRTVLAEVKRFEDTRSQLQDRVALIEQLRRGQSVPVQLLDQVSKSLPDALWLTQMQEKDGVVTIDGLSTTLIAVSDFVRNLGDSSLLKKPIDIVNTEVQNQQGSGPSGTQSVDVIKFSVKAQMANAGPSAAGPVKAAVQAPR
jgi:type IV pilus assembly protein PilN